MLHLVFQLDDAVLARIGADDDVLFLDNAVLGLRKYGRWADALAALAISKRVWVLVDDLTLRGIAMDELCAGLMPVDYAGFVDLTVQNAVIQSWR